LDYEALRAQFDRSADAMHRQFEGSAFWVRLKARMTALADEYYVRTGYVLGQSDRPIVQRKGWDSFWLKTFRRNVIENDRWPRAPRGGWLVPPSWFVQVGDVIRARFVVRYLDAVIDTTSMLEAAAREAGHGVRASFQATTEGYYAVHVGVTRRFEIPRTSFDTEKVRGRIELQVTTSVKDVVQELLHKYYNERRAVAGLPLETPGWAYMTDEFRSSYLGHMAHYLEGLIMDLRKGGS
jgi:hypothetical protein